MYKIQNTTKTWKLVLLVTIYFAALILLTKMDKDGVFDMKAAPASESYASEEEIDAMKEKIDEMARYMISDARDSLLPGYDENEENSMALICIALLLVLGIRALAVGSLARPLVKIKMIFEMKKSPLRTIELLKEIYKLLITPGYLFLTLLIMDDIVVIPDEYSVLYAIAITIFAIPSLFMDEKEID